MAKAGDYLVVGVVTLDNAVTETKGKGCWNAVEVGVVLVELGWKFFVVVEGDFDGICGVWEAGW